MPGREGACASQRLGCRHKKLALVLDSCEQSLAVPLTVCGLCRVDAGLLLTMAASLLLARGKAVSVPDSVAVVGQGVYSPECVQRKPRAWPLGLV